MLKDHFFKETRLTFMTQSFTMCLRSVFPGMTIKLPSDLGSAHRPSCLPVLSTSGSLFSCCSFLGSFLPYRSPLRCHSLKGSFPGHPTCSSLPMSLRPVIISIISTSILQYLLIFHLKRISNVLAYRPSNPLRAGSFPDVFVSL